MSKKPHFIKHKEDEYINVVDIMRITTDWHHDSIHIWDRKGKYTTLLFDDFAEMKSAIKKLEELINVTRL